MAIIGLLLAMSVFCNTIAVHSYTGLKTFSNWPTYPQFYVNGELVGGLDILNEMAESGELDDMLPKTEDLNARLNKLINSHLVMLFMKVCSSYSTVFLVNTESL